MHSHAVDNGSHSMFANAKVEVLAFAMIILESRHFR